MFKKWYRFRLKENWARLGPGLITGASDDDPSGIATYSQVGAQFGYGMLWTMVFSFPLMTAVQETSARIGRVTGEGIAANIRRYYSKGVLYFLVSAMCLANTLNLGADIAAMGAAVQLVVGGHALVFSVGLTLLSLGLELWVPYSRYVRYLKWLTIALFAYVATVFMVHVEWRKIVRHSFVPAFSFDRSYLTAFIAVLGTTISPYLFFWQASEEAEEISVHADQHPLNHAPAEAKEQIHRINVDTLIGMGVSNLIAFFIILTAAATLHTHGVTDIATAEQAAQALRPIAGRYAEILFAAGIVGTGLLALPVLAGSAAYAVGEMFGWKTSLEAKPSEAKGFYAVVVISTLLGLGANLMHISPMKALFWTAFLNGLTAVPILWMIMLMANNPRIMGRFTLRPTVRILGWLTMGIMALAALGLLLTGFSN